MFCEKAADGVRCPMTSPNNNVYFHFRNWKAEKVDGITVLDKVLADLVEAERIINGRESEPTMVILDSKSVKNTSMAEEKGYDGGKKSIRCEDSYCN